MSRVNDGDLEEIKREMYERAKREIAAEAYKQAYEKARADIGQEAVTSSYVLISAVNPQETHKSMWYAPYNALLNAHFPLASGYAVAPQWETMDPHGSIDFVVHSTFVTYVIKLKSMPIFFVEIKPKCHHSKAYTRIDADRQMRRRMDVLCCDSPVASLYGLSFLGSYFAVYRCHTAENKHRPRQRKASRYTYVDIAPEEWWCHNILTEEGKAKFNQIIGRVKRQKVAREERLRDPQNTHYQSPLTDYNYDTDEDTDQGPSQGPSQDSPDAEESGESKDST